MYNEDLTRFEFVLSLDKNIIVQRFFFVNNYNPKTKNSIELYNYVKDICDEICEYLKLKNLEYIYDDQYYLSDLDNVENQNENIEQNFLLQIKLDNHIFISRTFPANIYHPKARYSVDIRPKIRNILNDLSNVLSNKQPTLKYLNYKL